MTALSEAEVLHLVETAAEHSRLRRGMKETIKSVKHGEAVLVIIGSGADSAKEEELCKALDKIIEMQVPCLTAEKRALGKACGLHKDCLSCAITVGKPVPLLDVFITDLRDTPMKHIFGTKGEAQVIAGDVDLTPVKYNFRTKGEAEAAILCLVERAAAADGHVGVGQKDVQKALQSGEAALVVLSSEISAPTDGLQDLVQECYDMQVPCVVVRSAKKLGRALDPRNHLQDLSKKARTPIAISICVIKSGSCDRELAGNINSVLGSIEKSDKPGVAALLADTNWNFNTQVDDLQSTFQHEDERWPRDASCERQGCPAAEGKVGEWRSVPKPPPASHFQKGVKRGLEASAESRCAKRAMTSFTPTQPPHPPPPPLAAHAPTPPLHPPPPQPTSGLTPTPPPPPTASLTPTPPPPPTAGLTPTPPPPPTPSLTPTPPPPPTAGLTPTPPPKPTPSLTPTPPPKPTAGLTPTPPVHPPPPPASLAARCTQAPPPPPPLARQKWRPPPSPCQ